MRMLLSAASLLLLAPGCSREDESPGAPTQSDAAPAELTAAQRAALKAVAEHIRAGRGPSEVLPPDQYEFLLSLLHVTPGFLDAMAEHMRIAEANLAKNPNDDHSKRTRAMVIWYAEAIEKGDVSADTYERAYKEAFSPSSRGR